MKIFVINKKSGSYSKSLEKMILFNGEKFFPNDFYITYTDIIDNEISFVVKEKLTSNDTLIAVGGDGVINICLNYLYVEDLIESVSLGIIPLGTGNNLLKALDLSKNITKSFKILSHGKLQKLQFSLLDNRKAFFNCSCGFSAKVISNRNFKGRIGYVIDIIRNLAFSAEKVKLKTSEILVENNFSHLYFINTRYYASIFEFLKKNKSDEAFDIYSLSGKFSIKILIAYFFLIFGKNIFQKHSASELLLESNKNFLIELDGDLYQNTANSYYINFGGYINVISG